MSGLRPGLLAIRSHQSKAKMTDRVRAILRCNAWTQKSGNEKSIPALGARGESVYFDVAGAGVQVQQHATIAHFALYMVFSQIALHGDRPVYFEIAG